MPHLLSSSPYRPFLPCCSYSPTPTFSFTLSKFQVLQIAWTCVQDWWFSPRSTANFLTVGFCLQLGIGGQITHKRGQPEAMTMGFPFLLQYTMLSSSNTSGQMQFLGVPVFSHCAPHTSKIWATPPHVEVEGQYKISPTNTSSPRPISSVSWLACLLLVHIDPEQDLRTENIPSSAEGRERPNREAGYSSLVYNKRVH